MWPALALGDWFYNLMYCDDCQLLSFIAAQGAPQRVGVGQTLRPQHKGHQYPCFEERKETHIDSCWACAQGTPISKAGS